MLTSLEYDCPGHMLINIERIELLEPSVGEILYFSYLIFNVKFNNEMGAKQSYNSGQQKHSDKLQVQLFRSFTEYGYLGCASLIEKTMCTE